MRARIVLRTATSWRVVDKPTGDKGKFYIRTMVNGKPKYTWAGEFYDMAEAAQNRAENKYKAAALGAVITEPPPPQRLNRLPAVLDFYIKKLSHEEEKRSLKSIKATRSELEAFFKISGKIHIQDLQGTAGHDALVAYRQYLVGEKYEPDTIRNKLMYVVTFLKGNGVLSITGIYDKTEWKKSKRKNPAPDPYTRKEIAAMRSFATPDEDLIIWMLKDTGMRNKELAVAELEDINFERRTITVKREKSKFGWRAKNDRAARVIQDLDPALLAKLKLRSPGLLFPNKTGHVENHFLRMVERLAGLAGVVPTTKKTDRKDTEVKNNWIHRFRDTNITNRAYKAKNVQELMKVCEQIGHSNFQNLQAYVGMAGLEDIVELPQPAPKKEEPNHVVENQASRARTQYVN